LGRDRRAHLILQCSVNGLIDYSKFNSNSIQDLIKERLILRYQEAEVFRDLLNLQYSSDTTIISSGLLKPEVVPDKLKRASNLYKQITNLSAPWVDISIEEINELSMDDPGSLQSRWENIFGKLDSPEVKAKLESLKKQTESTAKSRLQFN